MSDKPRNNKVVEDDRWKLAWGRMQSRILPSSDGCHIWTGGGLSHNGYGRFALNTKRHMPQERVPVHRIAYVINKGNIPEGYQVCHKCDNKLCVNPEHLFLGTPQENIKDKVNKGRQAKGEKIHSSKLTEKDVIFIRKSNLDKWVLAAKFNVTERTIRDVKAERTWGWTNQKRNDGRGHKV